MTSILDQLAKLVEMVIKHAQLSTHPHFIWTISPQRVDVRRLSCFGAGRVLCRVEFCHVDLNTFLDIDAIGDQREDQYWFHAKDEIQEPTTLPTSRLLAMALTLNITDTGRIHGANLFKNTVRGTMKPLTSPNRDYKCSGLYNSNYHSMRKYHRCGYFVWPCVLIHTCLL